jgi:hypothetical protein
MADLYIFDKKIESIFQLLGENEDNISYSVGYVFANSSSFLHNFLSKININVDFEPNEIIIRLQQIEKGAGRTDFEIIHKNKFHIIVEAKRGWTFPSIEQLEEYSTRPSFVESIADYKRIIVCNESIPAFTTTHFTVNIINSIPVEVISWKEIFNIAQGSKAIGQGIGNKLLNELIIYLKKISTMQEIDSNWVYVVTLSNGNIKNSTISTRDIVSIQNKYFHPVGGKKGGWPKEPPNYIAFRYDGRLQSIHHIDRYEVFEDPSFHFPNIPTSIWAPHYLYYLGPPIIPNHIVYSGENINKARSLRVWAMLDLLLTCETVQEARDKSNERVNPVH